MFIYYCWLIGECGYDEYDSFIVIAKCKTDAMALILKEVHNNHKWSDENNVVVKCIGKPISIFGEGIVLGSYNAG